MFKLLLIVFNAKGQLIADTVHLWRPTTNTFKMIGILKARMIKSLQHVFHDSLYYYCYVEKLMRVDHICTLVQSTYLIVFKEDTLNVILKRIKMSEIIE